MSLGANFTNINYTRDVLKRGYEIKTVKDGNGYFRTFSYASRGNSDSPEGTTNYIDAVSYYNVTNNTSAFEKTEAVAYNSDGNIVRYDENTYEYDRIGRIVRENNKILDKTYTFVYNVGGNIVSKNEYAYTEGVIEGEPTKTYNYSYGDAWKDQLTNFDGQSIVYDACGNPTSYLGATLIWSRGRLLTRFTKDSTTSRMIYDANGIRMSKLRVNHIDIVDSSYIYDSNGRLRTETEGTYTRRYLYSSDGIVGYEENGERFIYRKNLFGDITAIYQGATKLAEYVYDAWGNCTVTYDTNGIGARNPMRYRGYYWDKDLKMYYLMTRYYDPKTGRFINADTPNYLEPKTINGLNLYAYCKNNPIMCVDPTGNISFSMDDVSNILGAVFLATIVVIWVLASMVQNSDSKPSFNISCDHEFGDFSDSFVTINDSGLSVGGVDYSAWTGYIYLNKDKSRFLYLSLGNFAAFLGKLKDKGEQTNFFAGGKLAASLLEIGYDGVCLNLSLPLVGIGWGAMINNGKLDFSLDLPIWPGLNWDLDLGLIVGSFVNAISPK